MLVEYLKELESRAAFQALHCCFPCETVLELTGLPSF